MVLHILVLAYSTVCFMDHTSAHSPVPYKDKEVKRYIHTQQHLKARTKSIDWWDKRWLMRVRKRVDGSVPSPGYFLEKWQSALCPLYINDQLLSRRHFVKEINETTSGQEQIRLPRREGGVFSLGPVFLSWGSSPSSLGRQDPGWMGLHGKCVEGCF